MRKLDSLATFSKGSGYSKRDLVEEGSPIILYGRLYTKYETLIKDVDTFVVPKGNSTISEGNEVIVPASGETSEDISRAAVVDKSGILMGGDLNIIKPKSNLNSVFLAFTISNGSQQKELSKRAQGNSVVHLYNSELKKVNLLFPSLEEQKIIGSFFIHLDHLITLHQRKLDKLKRLKQGYLQQLFPKNDKKVPRIRFANFEGDWKQCKLGEIGSIQSGIGFPDSEQGGREGTPFFKVSDMNNTGNEHEMKTANNYVSKEQLKRMRWKPNEGVPAVIFAKVGAAIMLNRKRIICTPFLNDNNTMTYVFDKSWNIDFGKTLFDTINLPRFAQIGALPSYNGSDIENIKVSISSKNEQTQIGSFFKNLDNTITLHQSKLDKLKLLKQALLQKMFI
nr:restriction endonuclease subunit S [Lactococcus sp. S64]